MNKSICLIGNPNCGKTTIFNLLTGSNQRVGNWAGVTTYKKEGVLKSKKDVSIVDLPGIYSLTPNSLDEAVVIDYLKKYKDGIIINVLDGTNLKRSLYLTLSLIKLGLPVVVAVNMIDELKREGIKLNEKKLSSFLGVPVFQISAKNREGINALVDGALSLRPHKSSMPYIAEEKIYSVIEKNLSDFLTKTNTELKKRTEKIDKVLIHTFFGSTIFIMIMLIVYFLSLKLGGIIGDKLIDAIDKIGVSTAKFLLERGVSSASVSLLVDGVIKGVGTVLSFLPHLLIMFFLMTALEESGYTARVSLLFDKIFSSLSMSGKSVIPFVLSCGCSVAGVEATRTIGNSEERELTIMLLPFLPCGAKSAVFGWFSYVFFGGSALVALSLYLLGIVIVFIISKIHTTFKKKKEASVFVLELPTLRMPRLKDIFCVLGVKVREFLIKSGTIILAVSIAVWLLTNFGFCGYTEGEVSKSFLYLLGNGIKYLFYPLGFGNWQASVSVITGILAKEAVVETMQILTSYPQTLFSSGFSVYAFMAFTLLSPPCIASISVALRELGDKKKIVKMIMLELVVAYVVAFLINIIGVILSCGTGLILSLVIAIIILIIFLLCIKNLLKRKCGGLCASCRGNNCETKNNV